MSRRLLIGGVLLLGLTLPACDKGGERPPGPSSAGNAAAPGGAAPVTAPDGLAMATIQPAELAELLEGSAKPLLFHMGFRKLYEQAHIPGSEFLGAGTDAASLARLRERLAGVPKDAAIVVYCGCCPWQNCPNMRPAFAVLHELGYTNAKVLFIGQDFGRDWVERGYPVERGD